MTSCNKCIINNNYPEIQFDENGTCSICKAQRQYVPAGEDKLLDILNAAKARNCEYDALVPLSGGKDSTYILHLAVHVYKLKVAAMTYDNGLFSPLALENIRRSVEITKVKHVFCKPNPELQKKIYRTLFLQSGDICGACDIGTKAHILKVAEDLKVPLILYGTSPLEEDSFLPDSIQDIERFKYILRKSQQFSKKEINDFLVYPDMNHFKLSWYKYKGRFGREVRPLFFIPNPTDRYMGEIIAKEMDWKEDTSKEYSKHFDCIAEPLTNYVRHQIYGYERRLCQYSNMVRRNEVTREKALELYRADDIESKPSNYRDVLHHLGLKEEDLQTITNNTPLKFESHTSRMNRLFARIMKLKQSSGNKK